MQSWNFFSLSKVLATSIFSAGMTLASASTVFNFNDVDIGIETLDNAAVECGISKELLDAAVRVPLSNSRLIARSSAQNYLYVNANILSLSNGMCIINLELNFRKYSQSELKFGTFWTEATLMHTSKMNASKRVSDALEVYTKQFIAAWLKANQN